MLDFINSYNFVISQITQQNVFCKNIIIFVPSSMYMYVRIHRCARAHTHIFPQPF